MKQARILKEVKEQLMEVDSRVALDIMDRVTDRIAEDANWSETIGAVNNALRLFMIQNMRNRTIEVDKALATLDVPDGPGFVRDWLIDINERYMPCLANLVR